MKYFFRFLRNNPLYAAINVVGLALSLMFVILIGDYTYRQYSIDKWHRNHDRIYLLGTKDNLYSWSDVTNSLKDRYPEIEETCRIAMENGIISHNNHSYGEDTEDTGNIMLADPTFFKFLDFKVLQGDATTAFDSPEKCVITKTLASVLFPDEDPIGKHLSIIGSRSMQVNDGSPDPYDTSMVYTVSAVIKDLDRTALLNQTAVIANFERAPQILGYRYSNNLTAETDFGGLMSFLMMKPGANIDADKIDDLNAYCRDNVLDFRFEEGSEIRLIPLDDVIFAPQNKGEGLIKGDDSLLGILLAVVISILMFAVTNYINLTVANTGFRSKEMATRRLLGSDEIGISMELIGESTLMVFFSFLIGGGLALLFQDRMSDLFKGKIDIISDISPETVTVCLLFIIFAGIVSGILPTISLYRFKPIDVVKGSFRYHSKMVLSRVFIILQNVITMTMLTATLTIFLQMNHLINAPLGYNTKNLYYVNARNREVMRDALMRQPYIERIGLCQGTTLDGNNKSMDIKKDMNGNSIQYYYIYCDKTFIDIAGLRLLTDFHHQGDGDIPYLNECAAGKFGITDNKHEIEWEDGKTLQVAGIFSDFHMGNVLEPYMPFVIMVREPENVKYPTVLVKTDGDPEAVWKLRELVKEIDGIDDPELLEFRVRPINSNVKESFMKEKHTMKVVSIFTGIAMLISVMGFIGMSIFFIRQRKKEIGVRRIMGSTTNEVLSLLLTKFCAPLLVSFVFAVPLSWFVMNRWLEGFSYRIGLSPWIFIASGAVSLLIALVSIFFQTLHAAHSNPADAIRAE